MNPNAGEPVNTSGTASAEVATSTSGDPVMIGLEGKLAAAQAAQGIVAPTEPSSAGVSEEEPIKSPEDQFAAQFGDIIGSVQPPVNEGPAPASVLTDAKLLEEAPVSISTATDNLTTKEPQAENPQAIFVQDIKNALEKLEEATKEKAAV